MLFLQSPSFIISPHFVNDRLRFISRPARLDLPDYLFALGLVGDELVSLDDSVIFLVIKFKFRVLHWSIS
jgi:hypothetical protein